MTVRSIARKLADIADAAWSHGDAASREDVDYGEMGPDAERRMERMAKQVETLAAEAIRARYGILPGNMDLIMASAQRDEILAEALVGDWAKVQRLMTQALRDAGSAASPGPAGPVNALVTLEPRDPAGQFNFRCCGGLRPAHTSNCRAGQ